MRQPGGSLTLCMRRQWFSSAPPRCNSWDRETPPVEQLVAILRGLAALPALASVQVCIR